VENDGDVVAAQVTVRRPPQNLYMEFMKDFNHLSVSLDGAPTSAHTVWVRLPRIRAEDRSNCWRSSTPELEQVLSVSRQTMPSVLPVRGGGLGILPSARPISRRRSALPGWNSDSHKNRLDLMDVQDVTVRGPVCVTLPRVLGL
jgi:hypothetical protein